MDREPTNMHGTVQCHFPERDHLNPPSQGAEASGFKVGLSGAWVHDSQYPNDIRITQEPC